MSVDGCDRNLVLLAQSGDTKAFDVLIRRYRRRVTNLAMRYTRNHADAEDVVQEAFIKAHLALPHFRGDSTFYSWLHRIAINAASTLLATRARQSRISACEPRIAGDADAPSAATMDLDTPEDLAMTEEVCAAVNAAITLLSKDQRMAIILLELEGLSYSEVAAAMFCPVGTVRSRVFRARETIDRRLRRVFDDGLGRSKRSVSAELHPMSETTCPV